MYPQFFLPPLYWVRQKLTHISQAGILVAAGQTDLKAVVTTGGTILGTQTLVPGFNGFSFYNMTAGVVSVAVENSAGAIVISGTGPIEVSTLPLESSLHTLLTCSRW